MSSSAENTRGVTSRKIASKETTTNHLTVIPCPALSTVILYHTAVRLLKMKNQNHIGFKPSHNHLKAPRPSRMEVGGWKFEWRIVEMKTREPREKSSEHGQGPTTNSTQRGKRRSRPQGTTRRWEARPFFIALSLPAKHFSTDLFCSMHECCHSGSFLISVYTSSFFQ